MEKWKIHVRAKLFQRDCQQKDPFNGLFNTYSRLLEKCELRDGLWEESQESSPVGNDHVMESLREKLQLRLQLREGELAREKLSQKVSDLTSSLYLKEAELQYCHSQVSRYRKEALSLARNASSLQSRLLECEYTLERQSKELSALRAECRALQEELVGAWQEKEQLLERWLEEKREEAERVNQHNDAQERWHHFTMRLTRHLRSRSRRQSESKTGGQCHTWTATDRPTVTED
ncbi:hypothetical protein MATL_G00045620 [Megalops atlanticus]|uniref:Autophagy-related protein 16 domain-containing protein n=1 Tax=Megalops atlanticus TaxID=7932 RepID=A0A9D3TBE4_MEGAT|nr:hypothetical protein MATL_G00045620 [Megalops atlanticus]